MIKPDGVKRKLVGKIIQRVEDLGLEIVDMKMFQFTREQAEEFYQFPEEWYEKVGKKLLKLFEEKGLDVEKVYGTRDPKEIGKKVREGLIKYVTSGPVVALRIKGNEKVIEIVRKLIGDTDPLKALPGTIRGDFSSDSIEVANLEGRSVYNVVHASDSPENAKRELKIIFGY